MSQSVIKVDKQTLLKVKKYYEPHSIKAVPYSVFTAKVNSVTITGYPSGKILFQGQNAVQESQRWTNADSQSPPKSAEKTVSDLLPVEFDTWAVVGSDEVGNDSYFGSLVVSSVYVPRGQIPALKQMGVRDSKNLTDVQIIQLAKHLEETTTHSLTIVTPEKYNQVQPTMTQGKMKAILHNHNIGKLLKKMAPSQPEAILIDQFELPSTYRRHIADQKEQFLEKVYFKTKAESSHVAVAAASILARYFFLQSLDELSKIAGIRLPSGAGQASDLAAASIYQKQGMDGLRKTAKLHFANTEKAIAIAAKRR